MQKSENPRWAFYRIIPDVEEWMQERIKNIVLNEHGYDLSSTIKSDKNQSDNDEKPIDLPEKVDVSSQQSIPIESTLLSTECDVKKTEKQTTNDCKTKDLCDEKSTSAYSSSSSQLSEENFFSDHDSEVRYGNSRNKWCVCNDGNRAKDSTTKICVKCSQYYHLSCLGYSKKDISLMMKVTDSKDLICPVCKNDTSFIEKYKEKIEYRKKAYCLSADSNSQSGSDSDLSDDSVMSFPTKKKRNQRKIISDSDKSDLDVDTNRTIHRSKLNGGRQREKKGLLKNKKPLQKEPKLTKSTENEPRIAKNTNSEEVGKKTSHVKKQEVKKKQQDLVRCVSVSVSDNFKSNKCETQNRSLMNNLAKILKKRFDLMDKFKRSELLKANIDIQEISRNIEKALIRSSKNVTKQYRMIALNLSDQKNETFIFKVLNGDIKPDELASMNSCDMASDESKAIQAEEREKDLQARIEQSNDWNVAKVKTILEKSNPDDEYILSKLHLEDLSCLKIKKSISEASFKKDEKNDLIDKDDTKILPLSKQKADQKIIGPILPNIIENETNQKVLENSKSVLERMGEPIFPSSNVHLNAESSVSNKISVFERISQPKNTSRNVSVSDESSILNKKSVFERITEPVLPNIDFLKTSPPSVDINVSEQLESDNAVSKVISPIVKPPIVVNSRSRITITNSANRIIASTQAASAAKEHTKETYKNDLNHSKKAPSVSFSVSVLNSKGHTPQGSPTSDPMHKNKFWKGIVRLKCVNGINYEASMNATLVKTLNNDGLKNRIVMDNCHKIHKELKFVRRFKFYDEKRFGERYHFWPYMAYLKSINPNSLVYFVLEMNDENNSRMLVNGASPTELKDDTMHATLYSDLTDFTFEYEVPECLKLWFSKLYVIGLAEKAEQVGPDPNLLKKHLIVLPRNKRLIIGVFVDTQVLDLAKNLHDTKILSEQTTQPYSKSTADSCESSINLNSRNNMETDVSKSMKTQLIDPRLNKQRDSRVSSLSNSLDKHLNQPPPDKKTDNEEEREEGEISTDLEALGIPACYKNNLLLMNFMEENKNKLTEEHQKLLKEGLMNVRSHENSSKISEFHREMAVSRDSCFDTFMNRSNQSFNDSDAADDWNDVEETAFKNNDKINEKTNESVNKIINEKAQKRKFPSTDEVVTEVQNEKKFREKSPETSIVFPSNCFGESKEALINLLKLHEKKAFIKNLAFENDNWRINEKAFDIQSMDLYNDNYICDYNENFSGAYSEIYPQRRRFKNNKNTSKFRTYNNHPNNFYRYKNNRYYDKPVRNRYFNFDI